MYFSLKCFRIVTSWLKFRALATCLTSSAVFEFGFFLVSLACRYSTVWHIGVYDRLMECTATKSKPSADDKAPVLRSDLFRDKNTLSFYWDITHSTLLRVCMLWGKGLCITAINCSQTIKKHKTGHFKPNFFLMFSKFKKQNKVMQHQNSLSCL